MDIESIWPVVAAAIAAILIGYGWYHPRLFGSWWMRLSNTTPDMAERSARRKHVNEALGFLLALVVAYGLELFGTHLQINNVGGAAELGGAVWIAFVAPMFLWGVLWEHRSIRLFFIDASYWLVALVVMGVVLAL